MAAVVEIQTDSPCLDQAEAFKMFPFHEGELVREQYDSMEDNNESEFEEYAIWTPKSSNSARIPGAENLAEVPAAMEGESWQRSWQTDPQDEVSTTSNSVAEASNNGANLVDVVRRQEVVIASLLGRCQALEDQYLTNQQKLAEFEQAHADATGRCAVVEAKLVAVQAEKDVDGRIGDATQEETRLLCERLQNELATLKAQTSSSHTLIESGSSSTTLPDQMAAALNCSKLSSRAQTKNTKNKGAPPQKPPKCLVIGPGSPRGSKGAHSSNSVHSSNKGTPLRYTGHGNFTHGSGSSTPGQQKLPLKPASWSGEARQATGCRTGSSSSTRQNKERRLKDGAFDQKTSRRATQRSKTRMAAAEDSEGVASSGGLTPSEAHMTPDTHRQVRMASAEESDFADPSKTPPKPRASAALRRTQSAESTRREGSTGRRKTLRDLSHRVPQARQAPNAGSRSDHPAPHFRAVDSPPAPLLKGVMEQTDLGESSRYVAGPAGPAAATSKAAPRGEEAGRWRTGPPMYAGRSSPATQQVMRSPDDLYVSRSLAPPNVTRQSSAGTLQELQRHNSSGTIHELPTSRSTHASALRCITGAASREDLHGSSATLEATNGVPPYHSQLPDVQEAGAGSEDGSLPGFPTPSESVAGSIVVANSLQSRVDKSQIEVLTQEAAETGDNLEHGGYAAPVVAGYTSPAIAEYESPTGSGYTSPAAGSLGPWAGGGHQPLPIEGHEHSAFGLQPSSLDAPPSDSLDTPAPEVGVFSASCSAAGKCHESPLAAPGLGSSASLPSPGHGPAPWPVPQASPSLASLPGLAASSPEFQLGLGSTTPPPPLTTGRQVPTVVRQSSATRVSPPSVAIALSSGRGHPVAGQATPPVGGRASPIVGGRHASPQLSGHVSPPAMGRLVTRQISAGPSRSQSPPAAGGASTPAGCLASPRSRVHTPTVAVYVATSGNASPPVGGSEAAQAAQTTQAAITAGLSHKAIQVMGGGHPPPVSGTCAPRRIGGSVTMSSSVTGMVTPPQPGTRGPCFVETTPRASRAPSATSDIYQLEGARQQDMVNAPQVNAWSSPVTMRFIQATQDLHRGEQLMQKVPATPRKPAEVEAALVRVMSRNAINEPVTKPGLLSAQSSPRGTKGLSPRAQRGGSLEPRQGAASVPFPPAIPDRMQHHLASASSFTPRLQGATTALSTPRIQGTGTPGLPRARGGSL